MIICAENLKLVRYRISEVMEKWHEETDLKLPWYLGWDFSF